MFKLRFRSIVTKILVMFLTVSLVEALVLIYMSHSLSESTMKTLIHSSSTKNAQSYSRIVGNWFGERLKEVNFYANSPLVSSMDWQSAEPYLQKEITTKIDIYDHFFISDRNGSYNTTIKRNAGNISDREYFSSVMQGQSLIMGPFVSRSTGREEIVLAAPIRDNPNNISGLMGTAISLDKLYRLIEDFRVDSPDSYSFIIDKKGIIIAHPDKSRLMKYGFPQATGAADSTMQSVRDRLLGSAYGDVECVFEGVKSHLYYYSIPNTDGWKLVTKIPDEYLHLPIKYASDVLLIIGMLGIILSAMLGLIISNNISAPIIHLKNVFTRAASGDLTIRADTASTDEVGEAARSFNEMMHTLSRLTFQDPLTDLPNRALFNDRLEHELARSCRDSEKLAVMIVDIDKFQNINSTLGHSVGDNLLKGIAARIKSCLNEDELISRMGEDKFALIFPEIGQELHVIRTAQSILDAFREPFAVYEHRLFMTAGIGIAFFPGDGKCAEDLIKNAYSAMLRAKKLGRGSYQLYDNNAGFKFLDKLTLDNSIHTALENNEFVLYFQPQVDAVSEKVRGAEALLRWISPTQGMISPARFIPIAEENGLIIPMGEWVLREACRQNKRWQDMGYGPIYIAVNISAIQLQQEGFIDTLTNILEETELDAKYLELEITESVAMENTVEKVKLLQELRQMGVRIAIDDFGIGYSSLNYLKNFAITTLKIDQSFVRELATDMKDAAIVTTILAIGHNLNLSVTAEGVETREQLEFLRDKGCDYIQGYYYSKPVPAERFEELLKL